MDGPGLSPRGLGSASLNSCAQGWGGSSVGTGSWNQKGRGWHRDWDLLATLLGSRVTLRSSLLSPGCEDGLAGPQVAMSVPPFPQKDSTFMARRAGLTDWETEV